MLGGLQEGFETNIKVKIVFKPVQQCQLIDEDSSQHKTAGGYQPFGWHLTITTKDALEVLVEVLHSHRAQLMEDAPHLFACVCFRTLSSVCCHQPPPPQHTQRSQRRSVVMLVSQHIAHIGRQLSHQLFSLGTIVMVGRGELSCEWYPHTANHRYQVEFPPIHPTMITRFGPMSLGVNQGVRHFSRLAVLFVPYTTPGTQHCAIGSHRSATGGPGLDKLYQMASQAANLSRQLVRQRLQAALPGAASRVASIFHKQQAQSLHLRSGLL